MSEDLEKFRKKIESYNQDQLKEVLVSLNKLKFPDKFEIIQEVLAQSTRRVLKEKQAETVAQASTKANKEELLQKEKQQKAASPIKHVDHFRKHMVSSIKKEEISNENQLSIQSTSSFLVVLVVLTSLISVYVMVQTFIPLPGKSVITQLANKVCIAKISECKPKKIPAPTKSVPTKSSSAESKP